MAHRLFHTRRRRGRPKGTAPNAIVELQQRQHEVANLLALGYKNTDIAAALHIHPQTVSNLKNQPLVQQKIDILRSLRDEAVADRVEDTIKAALPEAASLLRSALHGVVDGEGVPIQLRISTAKHILGIGGMAPVRKNETLIEHTFVRKDEIDSIRDQFLEERSRTLAEIKSDLIEEAQVVNE